MSLIKPPYWSRLQRGYPVARGLSSCYPMSEGAGHTVYDLTGNGVHGAATNTSWVTRAVGTGLSFDGSTSYVNCGGELSWSDALTVIAVVTYPMSDTSYPTIVGKWGSDSGAKYQWKVSSHYGGVARPYMGVSGDGTNPTYRQSSQTLIGGQTYMIAGVYEPGRLDIYVDAVKVNATLSAAIPSSLYASSADVVMGCQSLDATPILFFGGDLHDLKLFDRALAASEIECLYRHQHQLYHRDPIELWTAAAGGVTPPAVVPCPYYSRMVG